MTPDRYPSFEARPPWLGPDLQTIRNVVLGPAIRSVAGNEGERIWLPLQDGTGDRLAARWFAPPKPRDGAPSVILVHGLGGTEDAPYIRVTTTRLRDRGYPVVQLNLRGAGASLPACREQYHAGRSRDLRDALAALPEPLTQNGIAIVAYSLGGNMSLKFAAEYGGLRGLVAVSAPLDLAAASKRLLDKRNRLYHLYLLRQMKQETLRPEQALDDETRTLVRKLRTIFEFDEKFVAPRNGYANAAEYYAKNHARQFLADIEIPTLLLYASDDPLIPAPAYTDYPWSKNPRLVALITDAGGHVGFHGRGSSVPWHDRCIEMFLETV